MKGLAELLPKVDGNPSDEPRVSLDELIAQQRREEEAERQRARIEARHKASGVPARFFA